MSYRIDNRYYSIDPRYNSGYEDGRKASKGKIKDLELANAEYRDTIAQQAERIKELEAERDAERDNCVAVIATYQAELAALRQRIDDAPVVAHITEDGKVFSNGFVRDTDKPLISKEDLK